MKTQEKLKQYLNEIEKNNRQGKKINAVLEVNENAEKEAKKKGLLSGKVILVKSNINVLGLHSSCGSKVLEDYEATYDASVIKMIKDEGGIILGNTNCDEFACGWSGETSYFGPTKNPYNLDLVAGGSSSGSAASVAAGFCDMALGSDTGGSIRVPASHCGVVGVKPTYSSVSRYGLIDMCMSFDQIGPIAKNVSDAALLLSAIYKKDKRDSISQYGKQINLDNIDKTPKDITVGVLDFPISDKRIQDLVNEKIKKASEEYGWKIKKINIPYLDLAIATYFPIVYVEFFSATRKFDGRRYGKKIEDVCGPEVLRRILGGSEITKAEYSGRYYHQALKVRRLLQKEFEKVFKKVDAIISPVVPRLPHKIGDKITSKEMFLYDALTSPMNIVGNCAMSLPCGFLDLKSLPPSPSLPSGKQRIIKSKKKNGNRRVPVGMQIACDKFEDGLMLSVGRGIEKLNK